MAVVHAMVPGHPEWSARLAEAVRAFFAREVDAIIVAGGRCFVGGREAYNNPLLMVQYLIAKGIPKEKVAWRPIADDEVGTSANTVDTADEVGVALSLIQENGWQSAVIRPVSNQFHLVRIRVIYWARARRMSMRLHLESLPIPNMLGWKWAVMEVVLFWPYTIIDPGWTGPVARWMRARRRQGSGFGVAGGFSGKT